MVILHFCLIYSLFFNLVYLDPHSLVNDDGLAYETTASYLDDEFTNENRTLSNTRSIDLVVMKSTDESIKKYKVKVQKNLSEYKTEQELDQLILRREYTGKH